MISADQLRSLLAEHQERIDAVAVRPVRILPVTKGFGAELVETVMAAGATAAGENYAQELQAKSKVLSHQPQWHFIGRLQSNKVRQIASLVHLWQSIDSASLVDEVAKRAPGAAILVQVDLAEAPGRGGCSWNDAPALVDHARSAGLDVRGLMGVAPHTDPEEARPVFRRLAHLATGLELPEVSMGMSADYEVAVQEGATLVRLGSSLFGSRPPKA